MKTLLIQPIFLLFCLCLLMLPALVHGHAPYAPHDINILFDIKNGTMLGDSEITLPPELPLQLYFGDLKNVTAKVKQEGEKEKILTVDDKQSITLPSSPKKQTVTLSWQLTPTDGGHGSGNLISAKGITLTGLWHPVANHEMLFSLTAALPRNFDAVTEGDELVVSGRGDQRQLKASYAHPIQSINFAAGPYTVRSRKVGATTLYTYFFQEDAGLASDYLNKAAGYIKRYEKLIGSFPFKRYSIVENRLPTGYGMPGFTLLGQAVIRLPFIKDTSLGHEILHSWFGNAVGLDGTGNWCEGLTTYLADQAYAADKGEGVAYRKNQMLRYHSYVHQNNITSPIDFRHGGDSQPMARKMRTIGYDKSGMIFHILRLELGDEQFYAGLRRIYEENKYKQIGWTDIETVFSDVAGKDLSKFFGQWLLRHDVPNLTADKVTLKQKDGMSELSFHLIQQNEAPYRLQVPVEIQTGQGVVKKRVEVTKLDQQVSITLDSLPTELHIDPEYDLMRILHPSETNPAWTQLMGAEQKTVVLPPKEEMERYMPLVADLERQGCTLIKAADLKNSTLANSSFVFLGNSSHTMGLFGPAFKQHPAKGFTLDVRKNPLNPHLVMVLVSSSSTEETMRVIRKLSHYGKYSYLHFKGGTIQEKQIAPSTNGISVPLLTPPSGMPVQQIRGFDAIIDDLLQSRVIYVGETHTDYGVHLLQLQVIQALYQKYEQYKTFDKNMRNSKATNLAIGMEMFPRSSQQALDDYIDRSINEAEFLKQSNYFKVWGFDYRLYRPIINYARKNGIQLVGLNLEKKIVSSVFKKGGTDELTAEQWDTVAAERDLELPGYSRRLKEVHAMHGSSPHGSGFAGFIQAQSIWDETIAESIVNYMQAHPEKRMVVIAGTGHVYKDSAIPPRVARRMDIRQSVLIADNGMGKGLETGRKADYLMFTESIELEPAGKIGVILEEITGEKGKPDQVRIIGISPHGKAGQAGIMENDIVLTIDGLPVTSVGDLKAALMDTNPGDTALLTIRRQEKTLEIRVELSGIKKTGMMMPPGHPK